MRVFPVLILIAGAIGFTAPALSDAATNTMCDFDGDGFGDLAIGVPGEDLANEGAGAVHVLYGSSAGLTDVGAQFWHLDRVGVQGVSGENDFYGYATACADFNGDDRSDLAVGIPGDDVSGLNQAGAISVLYGTLQGLSAAGDQYLTQDSAGIEGAAEAGDGFGSQLAGGDFDADGYFDIAVGVPGEDIDDVFSVGLVNVIYGSQDGLETTRDQIWHQDSPGILGTAELGDSFGSDLSVGDFNGDGNDDLAVSVFLEDLGGQTDVGGVNVLYGGSSGLSATANQLWHQGSPGVQGANELLDRFGSSISSGDFNGDGRDDLAIGVPGEDVGSVIDAGSIQILLGSGAVLTAIGNQIWSQASSGIIGSSEFNDFFGTSTAAADFDGDGYADVAVGVPGEAVTDSEGDDRQIGSVAILYGSSAGVTSDGDQLWSKNSPGIKGFAESESFGAWLRAGNFDADSFADLAIGTPDGRVGGIDAGTVNVLHGTITGIGPARDELWDQAEFEQPESFDEFGWF